MHLLNHILSLTNRNVVRIVLLTVVAAGVSASASAQPYSLVWADEFDGPTLDAANWTPDIGDGCPALCGWGNNELQYYRAENVEVSDGNLILTSLNQPFGGRSFTSGKITSQDKFSFQYGRIEMRAQLPVGGGMWPAFWMMPQDEVYGGWAASGEIDVMEAANTMTWVGGALHFGGSWPDNASTNTTYSPAGVNFSEDFHVYAVEWAPDSIRWYVDDVQFALRTSPQWFSLGAPANQRAPFDQEFYILLNTAVGGDYTGCLEPHCITAAFPQQYLIDYVRVYQRVEPTNTESLNIPETYALEASYPNPFNQSTTIRFGLPEPAEVKLTVFDALGRQVRVLLDGSLGAGRHEVQFNGADLPSGAYFCRLETPRGSHVQAVLLAK